MSAFFVSRQTIHDAVTAWTVMIPQPRSLDSLNNIGRVLWHMNADALRQRYNLEGTDELAEYKRHAAFYVYALPKDLTTAQMAKSVSCLVYQCSEGDVPETWHSYKVLDGIDRAMGEPEGYDEAQWDRDTDAA